jgi:hypothetical protein
VVLVFTKFFIQELNNGFAHTQYATRKTKENLDRVENISNFKGCAPLAKNTTRKHYSLLLTKSISVLNICSSDT